MSAPALSPTTDYDTLKELLRAEERVAVYLSTETCAPCRAIRPFVKELFADDGWRLIEVDTPSAPTIAGQLLIFAHPTLLLFGDGREYKRFSRIFRRDEVAEAKEQLERLMA